MVPIRPRPRVRDATDHQDVEIAQETAYTVFAIAALAFTTGVFVGSSAEYVFGPNSVLLTAIAGWVVYLLAKFGLRRHKIAAANRSAFTLIELLVVITIILIVSILALPPIINALAHRQVSEAARILQANLAGARDAAIRDNAPSGIRLIPDPVLNGINPATGLLDPTFPLVYNRMVPIGPAPNYSEGNLSIYDPASYLPVVKTVNSPSGVQTGVPCLVVEQAVLNNQGVPNSPTNWFWNVRVGDQVQINNAGPWYTICGPMQTGPAQGNPEMFVNIGPPGTSLPTLNGGQPCEFLLLVNGRDDNGNGWVDEGWDGVDNNGNGKVDEAAEWEVEQWLGSLTGV